MTDASPSQGQRVHSAHCDSGSVAIAANVTALYLVVEEPVLCGGDFERVSTSWIAKIAEVWITVQRKVVCNDV